MSVSVALTALLKFFHATHLSPRLRAYRPWPKFLAVKGVVFMTWFQGVAIQLAVRFDVLGSSTNLSDRSAALAFQNFLVCVEMFLAALAHAHIFGADEWQPDYVPVHLHASVADNLAIDDFVKDFRSVLAEKIEEDAAAAGRSCRGGRRGVSPSSRAVVAGPVAQGALVGLRGVSVTVLWTFLASAFLRQRGRALSLRCSRGLVGGAPRFDTSAAPRRFECSAGCATARL